MKKKELTNTTESLILIRYNELALKGENRGWFETRLAKNIQRQVARAHGLLHPSEKFRASLSPIQVTQEMARQVLSAPANETTYAALRKCYGIANFSPTVCVPTEKKSLLAAVFDGLLRFKLQHNRLPNSFRIDTRRSHKVLFDSSMEADRFFGSAILNKHPEIKVDLKNAEWEVGIEIRKETSYVYTEKYKGPYGLPVGTNGKVLTLISGGIDSPVAALQMLKRGVSSSFVHFYGTPFVGPEVLEKIEDLVRLVNQYQGEERPLRIVPFGKLQEKIALVTNPKMRTLLYRRMMLRIANAIAERIEAQAIVTGESLGQVASQTLENITTVEQASYLPVLRPLIGYDKREIILKAQEAGSFEISVRPAVDCCTLFADRHPMLKSTLEMIQAEEAKVIEAYCSPTNGTSHSFDFTPLIEEALSQIEIRHNLV